MSKSDEPESLRVLSRHYRALKAPPGFVARVSARVEEPHQWGGRLRWAAAGIAAVALIVVLVGVLRTGTAPLPEAAGLYPDFSILAEASGWTALGGASEMPELSVMPDVSLPDWPESSVELNELAS